MEGTTFFDPEDTVVAPPTPPISSRSGKSLRHITDLINARRGEKGLKAVADLNSTGMTHHAFGPVKKSDVVKTNVAVEDGRELKIPAAILMAGNHEDFDGISGDIRTTGVVQYVVLQRPKRFNSLWLLPTPQQFHDLMNRIECYLLENDVECATAMKLSLIHI